MHKLCAGNLLVVYWSSTESCIARAHRCYFLGVVLTSQSYCCRFGLHSSPKPQVSASARFGNPYPALSVASQVSALGRGEGPRALTSTGCSASSSSRLGPRRAGAWVVGGCWEIGRGGRHRDLSPWCPSCSALCGMCACWPRDLLRRHHSTCSRPLQVNALPSEA